MIPTFLRADSYIEETNHTPGTMRVLNLSLLLILFATSTVVHANDNPLRDRYAAAMIMVDGNLVVGEPGGFSNPGMVHVLSGDARGSWDIMQTVSSSDAAVGDGFGSALVFSDGYLVVSSPSALDEVGAVYVFERSEEGAWMQVARVTGQAGDISSGFGASIAAGQGHLFIGASSVDARMGEVHVYELGGTFAKKTVLRSPDAVASAQFGAGLAVSDTHLLVGSPGFNTNRGRIEAFAIDSDLRRVGVSDFPDEAEGTRVGAELVDAGELVFSLNPRANRGAGALHVFRTTETSFGLETVLTPPDREGSGARMFGAAVARAGNEFIVSAPLEGTSGILYRYSVRDLAPLGTIESGASSGRSQFGASLAANMTMLAAGMPGDDYGLGSAALFMREGAMWSPLGIYSRPVPSLDPIAGESIECEDGTADGYGCQNVDLVSFIPLADMRMNRGVRLNDVWGWTDPETGKEIGIIGHMEAAVFVDLTDPSSPVVLGEITRTEGSPGSTHRDMKVYKDHAFIVADGSREHGMQIFDMTRLRDWPGEYQYYQPDVLYTRIASAHNIVINENTGYAYTVGNSSGGETCGGGLHMINVQDPKSPQFMGCFNDSKTGNNGSGATHDAQCVTYDGPDREHRGKEICVGSNGTAISIADVTDKDSPVAIAQGTYPNSAYVHQGWFTDDHRYFYQNDEADETSGVVDRTRTMIWDLTDLEEPEMIAEYFGDSNSTDHNLYVKGDIMYQTNNASGLRVVNIRDRANPVEVGYFDTTPKNRNVAGFDGTWSSYPYFESGNILVTSRREGLFILRARQQDL